MKRLMMAVGCCACACTLCAREVLWTGPSGGNWTEVSNWVDAETKAPIVGLAHTDIAVFDVGGGEMDVVSDYPTSEWPSAQRIGGIRVLNGSVTISGDRNVQLYADNAIIDVAADARLNLKCYLMPKVNLWNGDSAISKTGDGTLAVYNAVGIRANTQNDPIPHFDVKAGTLLFAGKKSVSWIDELIIRAGATVQVETSDTLFKDLHTKLTVEKGGLLNLNGTGAFYVNGITGEGTVRFGLSNSYLTCSLAQKDCLFGGRVEGGGVVVLENSEVTTATNRMTVTSEDAFENAGKFAVLLDEALVFGPGVRDFNLSGGSDANWLRRMPSTNVLGLAVRFVGRQVEVSGGATVLSGKEVCGAPAGDFMNKNETMFSRARHTGVRAHCTDALAELTLDGSRVRFGVDLSVRPTMDSLSILNGSVAEFVTPLDAKGFSANNSIRLDGGILRLLYPQSPYGMDFFRTGDWTLKIGARGGRVEGVCESAYMEANRFDEWDAGAVAAEGVAVAGTLTFAVARNLKMNRPLSLSSPVRFEDGRILTYAGAYAGGVNAVFGSGDIIVGNAWLHLNEENVAGGTSLATGEGARLIYEGGARILVRDTPLTIGASGSSTPTLVHAPGGALFFADETEEERLDGTKGRVSINGPLAHDASGRLNQPVFTLTRMTADMGDKSVRRIDFSKYDGEKGLVSFLATQTDFANAENKAVLVDGAHGDVTIAAGQHEHVGALQYLSNVGDSGVLRIQEGASLTVGNGVDPACVILDSRAWLGASVLGGGTLDFGASEGVIVLNASGYHSFGPELSVSLTGSNGISFVSPFGLATAWIALSGNNTYSGGTHVNGVQVRVKGAASLGRGPVHVGGGMCFGGQVLFVSACEIANDFTVSGNGSTYGSRSINGGALWFGAPVTMSGAVNIERRVRFSSMFCDGVGMSADRTAVFTGVVSGGGLQLMQCESPVVFEGANTYTGGTEIVSSTLILRGPCSAGTGPVALDNGVLRFENTEPIVFPNDVEGLGTVEVAGSAPVIFTGKGLHALPEALRTLQPGSSADFPSLTNCTVAVVGELDLGGADVTVAGLSGSGIVSNGRLTVTGEINPGGEGVVGTLSFADGVLTAAGATYVCEVGDDGVDKIVAEGVFDLAGVSLRTVKLGGFRGTVSIFSATELSDEFAATKFAKKSHAIDYTATDAILTVGSGKLILLR